MPRPPVVAILGHIDHGKPTLLDYIRSANVVASEAGAITQHLSAYVVSHRGREGAARRITFLDTPGHEAFTAMRSRGARAADLVVLVVSAEEGVKAQTLEALAAIREAVVPFLVAITKIDKPQADVERTKRSLLENEILLEGLGGDVPCVPVSGKTGEGVPELLDLLLLAADLAELTADPEAPAEGVVIETHRDPRTGIAATLLVKNGALRAGAFVAAGGAVSPVRLMRDFQGKPVREAGPSEPIEISGWSALPPVGAPFTSHETKRAAQEAEAPTPAAASAHAETAVGAATLPVIVKADTAGTFEAVEHELQKLPRERVDLKLLGGGTGAISEGDLKLAKSAPGALVVGFNVAVDPLAADLAARAGIPVETFTVIYELSKRVAEELERRRPMEKVEEVVGRARVIKLFGASKRGQVLGARMQEGALAVGNAVRIRRRDVELGAGSIANLQQQKADTAKVDSGEFGVELKSKVEAAPGDTLEAFVVVEK